MWDYRYLSRIDLRVIPLILALMWISVLVISSMTGGGDSESFFTESVKSQIQWFMMGGWFFFFVGMDYRKLRTWSWVLYIVVVLLLIGLFFTTPIQQCARWYRISFLGREFQPSEYAKLTMVMALSCVFRDEGGVIQEVCGRLFRR